MNVTTLNDLFEKVQEDSKGKIDYNVNSNQLKMGIDGKLTTKLFEDNTKGFELDFTENGFMQFCDKMNAKELVNYGQKLYDMGETVRLAELFNFHLQEYNKEGNKDLWVRSKKGKARAVMTENYQTIDNDLITEIICNKFDGQNIDIVNFSLSDNYMNCRIRLLDKTVNAAKIKSSMNEKEDKLYMALHFLNSEVGLSSVNVFVTIYREICTNGLIRVEKDTKDFVYRKKHVGNNDREQISAMFDRAIDYCIQNGEGILEEFVECKKEEVELPMENIRYLSRQQGYSKKFTNDVEQAYLEEKDSTRYGIVNAFTRAAQNLDYERRIEVEKYAGNVMNANLIK